MNSWTRGLPLYAATCVDVQTTRQIVEDLQGTGGYGQAAPAKRRD